MQSKTDDPNAEDATTVQQEVRRAFVHHDEQPKGRREVELYIRTYMTLLESSGAVALRSLEPAHLTAGASLHAGAEEPEPDMSAFLYSANRLPTGIVHVDHILLGQSRSSFTNAGHEDVQTWEPVSSPGRRRRWYWDGGKRLAAFIASSSDLDDLIPSLVAYQLEWNKMSRLFRDVKDVYKEFMELPEGEIPSPELETRIREAVLMSEKDWERLKGVWGEEMWPNFRLLARDRKRMDMRMFGGTYIGYGRSTGAWWRPVIEKVGQYELRSRPVYFVSSNTHSIVNTLSGVAARRKDDLIRFIDDTKHPELYPELSWYREGKSRSSLENLLYFAARPYFHGPDRIAEREARQREEESVGIIHLEPGAAVDVGVQVIELNKLDPSCFDPRLPKTDLTDSDAIIVNINYPLGMAAYHIMSQIALSVDNLKGAYILGKAATLNGRIGDIMMANVVYDEHSGNTYWFKNAFGYDEVSKYLVFGAALDNQKAVTVKGTYLQNQGYLDFFYRENYTVVEMEAGPYLSALFEDTFLERHPSNEAINLVPYQNHFDLGIIHYASDTPYTRAHTLGARGLSFYGMDSTYASTIAILERIFTLEEQRLKERGGGAVTDAVVKPTSGFVSYVKVRFAECDPLGHVNNAVYLNYLEQVAIDHAAALGWSSAALLAKVGALFVARRHEIDYLQPAFEGDLLQVRTWPVEMRGARGLRVYDISRVEDDDRIGLVDRLLLPDELVPLPRTDTIVSARTEWAFMNPTTGRPARIPRLVADDFVKVS